MKNRTSKQSHSIYGVVGKALIIALIVSIVGAFVGTLMLNNEILPEESAKMIAFVIWVIAAFTGSISSSRFSGTESILPVLITNLTYAAVLAGIGILFFESNFGNILAAFLAIIAGSVPAILIAINNKSKNHKRIRYKV